LLLCLLSAGCWPPLLTSPYAALVSSPYVKP
jgi:hypothetical protein